MAKFHPGVLFLLAFSCPVSPTSQAEQLPDILRLRKSLGVIRVLPKNRIVRPVLFENTTIDVTVSVELSDIAGLKLDGREATITGRTCIKWRADTLRWNPENFNGLESINLRRNEVWVPDIEVFNRVSFVSPFNKYVNSIRVFSNGSSSFCELRTMTVSCDTDMYAFPVDKHQCSVLFGSSTYGLDKLNLIPFLEMTPEDYEKLNERFSEWRLRAADFRLVKGDAEDYFDYTLQLDLVIERNFSYHVYRFVIPMCIGVFLTALFCWLPMNTPQRFIMPLVSLLIMMYTSNQYFAVLSSSSTLPLFLRFATDLMFFTAFMIFLAILVMALDEKASAVFPTHPLLDCILGTKTVSNYILAEEALIPEAVDEPGSQSPVEQPPVGKVESARSWPRLLTALQRVFSVFFLSLYLVVYYSTIGSVE